MFLSLLLLYSVLSTYINHFFVILTLGFLSKMESLHTNYELQAFPPIRSHQKEIYTTHSPSSAQASFPILALALIGILTTAFLLIGYYVFAIKCCLNSHRIDILSPFFISRSRRRGEALIVYASETENRGLDESAIRSIPILHFNKTELEVEQRDLFECAVCLNEFQEEEKLRMLPSCTHIFHIDCIDIWLQNNANCPLCRSSISPTNHTFSPTSPHDHSVISGDQDFVIIEVRNGADQVEQATHRRQETANSDISIQSISPSPRKTEQLVGNKKKARKFNQVSSMGDECINVRAKDDQFSVQPIRRSISMDSSADRKLFLSIQEIIQQNRHLNEVNSSEGCSSSSSSKLRRSSFFSFGHGRGSRSASILPIQFEEQN